MLDIKISKYILDTYIYIYMYIYLYNIYIYLYIFDNQIVLRKYLSNYNRAYIA